MSERSPDPFDRRLAEAALAALPPVRDDEPMSLRQDILDELRDHLACAFRSELLRTNGDTARAERNVRERFGDPGRIARRLWFDAMKGKLMTQKILIGTCVVLVAASIGFYGLMWQAFAKAQERNAKLAAQSQAASAELLAQAQQTNAALLARVEELAKSNAISDPQWNQVTLRLVSPKDFPAPVVQTVGPVYVIQEKQGGESWKFEPDANAVIDCGLMQPGKYTVKLRTTWGEHCDRQIIVLPGRSLDVTITCPAAAPKTVPVEWTIDWPRNLASYENRDQTWLLVFINGELRREFGEDHWTMQDGGRLLAFHPDGRMMNLSAIEPPSDPVASAQLSRNGYVHEFLQSRRNDMPVVTSGQVWVNATYNVGEMAYQEWDESVNPLSILGDIHKPAVKFWNIPRGIFSNELDVALPSQQFAIAARETAHWTIDVPPGLIEWAKLRCEQQIRYPRNSIHTVDRSQLEPLFRPTVEPRLIREPVEAPRPGRRH